MNFKLKDRIEDYQSSTNYTLLSKVPIILTLNGRAFSKITSLIEKPYDLRFAECLHSTTLKLCSEIEGVQFAYQHNDQITLILRNDSTLETQPWFNNQVQKICSISASIATLHFNNCISAMDLNLVDDPLFITKVFPVPNVTEAINAIIYDQQHNFLTSIQFACYYELIKKYNKNTIKAMLIGLNTSEKIDLLKEECQIDFDQYESAFRQGIACYKIPMITNGVVKHKWSLNNDLPTFTKHPEFLGNIIF